MLVSDVPMFPAVIPGCINEETELTEVIDVHDAIGT